MGGTPSHDLGSNIFARRLKSFRSMTSIISTNDCAGFVLERRHQHEAFDPDKRNIPNMKRIVDRTKLKRLTNVALGSNSLPVMIGYHLVCTFAHLEWVENVPFCALEDRICHQVVRRFGSLRKTKFANDPFKYRSHQVNLFLAERCASKDIAARHFIVTQKVTGTTGDRYKVFLRRS